MSGGSGRASASTRKVRSPPAHTAIRTSLSVAPRAFPMARSRSTSSCWVANRRAVPTRPLRIEGGAWYEVTAVVGVVWPRRSWVSSRARPTEVTDPSEVASPPSTEVTSATGSGRGPGRLDRLVLRKNGWVRFAGSELRPRWRIRMPVKPSTSAWWILT